MEVLSDIRFPEYGGFIHIEDLLWQVIFLHNQLIWSFQKILTTVVYAVRR
jgi:hypothetical protein